MNRFMRFAAAAGLLAMSVSASAALVNMASDPYWPPLGSSGLDNVQFNAQTNGGVTVALGAHAYVDSALLPNDGISTFYAQAGTHPSNADRTRWSVDVLVNYGTATLGSYVTRIGFDIDPTAAQDFRYITLDSSSTVPTANGNVSIAGLGGFSDSFSMEADYVEAALGINFNPFSAGIYDFTLSVAQVGGAPFVSTNITVQVPEPGSLALLGAALLGLGVARRRRV